MNHCYRLVFNASLGTWVAAPDFARGVGKAAVRRTGAGAMLSKGVLTLALAAGLPVHAQTWLGLSGDYRETANWNPGVVPEMTTATAVFGAAGAANVSIAGTMHVGTFQFSNDAQAYTFDMDPSGELRFWENGIVNGSASTQTINAGDVTFRGNSSAGNAIINSSGNVELWHAASGGNATFNIKGARSLLLTETASLDRATVNLTGTASLDMHDSSSGGEAAISMGDISRLIFVDYALPGTTIGSLSGGGTVGLGARTSAVQLTIGGNHQSTTYYGIIRDNLSIVKTGSGTLTLAGNNGFSGGLTVDAGTLQVGDGHGSGTLGTGAVTNNASLVFNRDDTYVVGNVISGTGTLTQAGIGTLILTADNLYTGTTTISAGTLQVGDGGTSGALGVGDVINDGDLVFDRNDDIIVDNDISGTGDLTQQGTGKVTLTGDNTYIGTTTISAGTLEVGDGGTSGSLGTGAVINDSELVFDRNDNIIVGNDISGTGNLTQQGTGKVTLTGDNTYTGTTTIADGTLQVGNSGTTGSLGTGAVINDSRLVFNRSDNLTVANDIGGTGELVKQGTGTTTLTGNNTYTGTTTISAGRLQVGNGGATGSLGSGDVINNGELVFDRTGTVTVANDISGSGGLTQRGANGVLELLGSNTYSGNTYITGGGELRVAAGALGGALVEVDGGRLRALESMALHHDLVFFGGTNGLAVSDGQVLTVTGRTQISGPTTLTRFGGTGAMGAIRLENELLMFASTLDVNGVTTHLANLQGFGTLTSNGGPAEVTVELGDFGGSIAGDIALTKAGSDLLILSERNTYTGATTIAGGVVRLRAEGALADGTAVTLHGDSRLQLEGYDQSIGSLAGTSGLSSVELDGATLTVGSNGANTTYAGWIGSGALVKTGAGNLTLTGDFNDLASTHVAAGTLTIGDGGTSGTLGDGGVTNDGTLAFNRSDDVMVSHDITGSGRVRKLGAGMLELTGSNSYTGGTVIDGGTISIFADDNIGVASGALFLNGGKLRTTDSFGMTRTVTLTGNGTFDVEGTTLTLNGPVGGSGNLVKEGNGVLFLLADNNYTGATIISAGTLQVGYDQSTGSLGAGAVTNHGLLSFRRSGDFTVPNAISGTGQLRHYGDGTMVLTGDNSYTGMTTIADGTLQVGNGGTTGSLGSGDVANHGDLVFNRSDTISVANRIAETGSLTQAGSGHLVLTGDSLYTGGTFVNAGKLSVNGSIIGDTTVNSGGTLGGTGTVGNVTVASGGTLAPGNSIGTLSVNGNLRFAPGSIYRVEANPAGAADRVNTLGAGTITINGGTVDVRAGGAGYQRNTRYTILSSGGSTTGRFADATTNLAFLTPTLIYEGNAVLLNLQASDGPGYASAARTPNQRAVANHLQGFANTPSNATAAGLIQQIDNMSADQASAGFESMAGSPHASASQVASALGRNFSATLAARSGFGAGGLGNAMNDLSQVRYASLAPVHAPQDAAQSGGLWVQAVGAGGRLDADGNAAGSRYGSNGFVLGYDQHLTGRWTAGVAAGYSTSHWNSTSGDDASGKIESPQAGLYARYDGERVRVRIDGTVSRHDFTTDRTIEIGGAGAVANSKHDGHEWGLGAQVEMPIQAGSWELRPQAGIRHAHLKEDSFGETGPSPANLAVASRTTQNTLLSAGMHFVRPFHQGKGGIELRAVASHLAGDNDSPVTASIAGQPGSFTASGVPLERNALALGATVSGEVARNVNAYLDANYETRGSGQEAWRVTAGVRVSF